MTPGITEMLSGAGGQVGFKVPDRACTPPRPILALSTAVERNRAKDAWNAAQRLRLLIDLWTRFLCHGYMGHRLDDQTEDAVVSWFHALEPLGRVLDYFARRVRWPAELATTVEDIDRLHQIARSPTDRHRDSNPKAARRAVQPLIQTFKTLMLTEALCLHRLDLKGSWFGRSWDEVRSEIGRLTVLNGDWSGDEVVLDFAGALTSPVFCATKGALERELRDLTDLLGNYPTAAFGDRTAATRAGGTRGVKGRLTKADADRRTGEFLHDHPGTKSEDIARKIGCSPGLVRGTAAWRHRTTASRSRPAARPRGKRLGLDIALEEVAEERHAELEDAEEGAGELPELSREEQIKQLEREQQQDEARDKRRPRKRPPSS